MSDTVDETTEVVIMGDYVTIPIAGHDYLFERTEHGTLKYVGYSPRAVVEYEDEPNPFDPSEYR